MVKKIDINILALPPKTRIKVILKINKKRSEKRQKRILEMKKRKLERWQMVKAYAGARGVGRLR